MMTISNRDSFVKIDSQVEFLDGNPHTRFFDPDTVDEMMIKNETMLFNCDVDHAWKYGNSITRRFLNCLPKDWVHADLVVDSRVHMLMPGWYPCIPGWHHDDVPRTGPNGQPNYGEGQDRSEHIIMLANADIAPTEFAIGKAEFRKVPDDQVVYDQWHKDVEWCINYSHLDPIWAPNLTLVKFNDRTWHRGTAARKNGWRFFIRASRYYDKDGNPIARRNPRTNEIRRNAQVYMSALNAGW